jgi:hypothetical protein
MEFTELQAAFNKTIADQLASQGFLLSNSGVLLRARGVVIEVVQLQRQSEVDLFCVNLGLFYTFLPLAAALDFEKIDIADCDIRLRLTTQDEKSDQWWAISSRSIQEVATLMIRRGVSVFDRYSLEVLRSISVKSVEEGTCVTLASITKVRACLLLATLHDHIGNRDLCIEFANAGIRLAGMAVGPKKILKELLKRQS